MPPVPARVAERIKTGLKRVRSALAAARERDINESDTGLIVAAILSDVLGYDRFLEVTSEFAIRSTYCDLAVRLDGKLKLLIEIKAIGLALKDNHLKQAVDYGANQGLDYVVLTNGVVWRAYRIVFKKPIDSELVFEVDLLGADPRDLTVVEKLYLLSKEGIVKQAISDYHEEKQATSRCVLAALLQTDPVLSALRKEVRRVSPGVKVDSEQLAEILRLEVIKRDCLEGDQAMAAAGRAKRSLARANRLAMKKPGKSSAAEEETADSEESAASEE